MTTRGAVLLGIGMLILGLVLGMVSGGVAGFFVGQSMRAVASQNFPGFQRGPNNQTVPQNPQVPQTPQSPQSPRGRQTPQSPQGGVVPPAQNFVNGARVTNVIQNSPAATAGLQVGDTITAVDGTNLDANHSLGDLISPHKPGDKVTLAVTRGSQNLTLNVQLGQSPQDSSAAYLGITFAPVTSNGDGTNPRFRNPGNNNSLPNG